MKWYLWQKRWSWTKGKQRLPKLLSPVCPGKLQMVISWCLIHTDTPSRSLHAACIVAGPRLTQRWDSCVNSTWFSDTTVQACLWHVAAEVNDLRTFFVCFSLTSRIKHLEPYYYFLFLLMASCLSITLVWLSLWCLMFLSRGQPELIKGHSRTCRRREGSWLATVFVDRTHVCTFHQQFHLASVHVLMIVSFLSGVIPQDPITHSASHW